MDIKTERKCPQCSNTIVLENYDCLFYSSRFYHKECFVEKMTTKKRGAISIDEAKILSIDLRNQSIPKIKDIISKNHLYKWIQINYDVNLPKKFFEKMAAIYNGTYHGISRGIPASQMLAMFKDKRNKLPEIKNYNKSKGNIINGINLVYYDIAILINKYPSYLKYLEKKKILEAENKQKKIDRSLPKIDFKRINGTVKENRNKEINILEILDEV